MSAPTQKQRILAFLKEHGGAFNHELNPIAYRYAARIAELREEGHTITTEKTGPGVYRYLYYGQAGATADTAAGPAGAA